MVKIRVKKSEKEQFIFETTCDTKFGEIIPGCAEECKELANYGIYKSPQQIEEEEKKKIKEDEDEDEDVEIIVESEAKSEDLDPSGKRMGVPPGKEQKMTLEKEIKNCGDIIDGSRRKPITMMQLEEAIELLEAALKICYPMGLPEYDSITIVLNKKWKNKDFLDPSRCTMWFAGTQLMRENPVSSIRSVKRNERTTINCKLQKFGMGAPSREPVVDAETQKQLLSFYYKKQEETKKLLENEDDSFLNSSWADPGGMKKNFQGLNKINWK